MQPRPTIYNGIQMRSRLEAGYAAWLDRWGFTWEYEPSAFAGPNGQYLPDFRLRNVAHIGLRSATFTDVYVEVKPSGFNDHAALARRMSIIHSSHPDATLLLEIPGQQPRAADRGLNSEPEWFEMAWTYNVSSDGTYAEVLALATILDRGSMPWPPGYWNG